MTEFMSTRGEVEDVVATVLGVSRTELTANPVLAAHDWDSIRSLDALSQIERRVGVRLDLRQFHSMHTVDALVRLVERGLEASGGQQ